MKKLLSALLIVAGCWQLFLTPINAATCAAVRPCSAAAEDSIFNAAYYESECQNYLPSKRNDSGLVYSRCYLVQNGLCNGSWARGRCKGMATEDNAQNTTWNHVDAETTIDVDGVATYFDGCCLYYSSEEEAEEEAGTIQHNSNFSLEANITDLTADQLETINPLASSEVFGDPESRTFGSLFNRALTTVVFPLAGIILFILLLWGGLQMLSASVAGKQNLVDLGKKKITSAIIGFVLLFISFWLWRLVEILLGINITG